jgi:hypothetical protein
MHAPDEFVPDQKVRKELGISGVTLWRWDRDRAKAALGWPPPITFAWGKTPRKFRSRQQLEIFKANVLRLALLKRAPEHGADAA